MAGFPKIKDNSAIVESIKNQQSVISQIFARNMLINTNIEKTILSSNAQGAQIATMQELAKLAESWGQGGNSGSSTPTQPNTGSQGSEDGISV
jgi:hypothetical protein